MPILHPLTFISTGNHEVAVKFVGREENLGPFLHMTANYGHGL